MRFLQQNSCLEGGNSTKQAVEGKTSPPHETWSPKRIQKSKIQCFVDVNLLKSHLGLFPFYHQNAFRRTQSNVWESREESPSQTEFLLKPLTKLLKKIFFAHNSALETLLELTRTIAKFFDKILSTNFDRKQ